MKTRFGVSVTAMAALVCFLAIFGGYTPVLLVVGYVMVAESDEFLKKTSLKALGIMIAFSVLGVIIGYIPNAIELINRILGLFGGDFSISFLSRLINLIDLILSIAESVILLVMGFMALKGQSFPIGMVDKFLSHNFGTKVCSKCGANLPDGTAFCPNCGEKVQ